LIWDFIVWLPGNPELATAWLKGNGDCSNSGLQTEFGIDKDQCNGNCDYSASLPRGWKIGEKLDAQQPHQCRKRRKVRMNESRRFTLQSLGVIVILNGLLLGAIYWLVGDLIQPHLTTILGLGLLITLVLWFIIQFLGRSAIEQAAVAALAAAPPPPRVVERPATPPAPKVAEPGPPPEVGAVQLLALFQRQGRLVDFLQEDLTLYEDAQIGAAVRSIQENCKQALVEHVTLEPILAEAEGATVTVQPGFDAHAIRLVGEVAGEPPFRGELRHRGWRVRRIELPVRTTRQEGELIIAPAEVEVGSV
jgi:hypothetical protein